MTNTVRKEAFDRIGDGLEWRRIYWQNGPSPRGSSRIYAVKDPPTSGWQTAVVIVGEKRSTIFCPFSFDSWLVPNGCGELESAKHSPFDPEWFAKHMPAKWAECNRFGYMKDYDTAALVLKRMGLPVPETVMKDGATDTRVKGGKEVAKKLEKPVKLKGKRGQFLLWFLEKGGSAAVREAMATFEMTRSNALSYLYMLQKDHGIGYELVGEVAHVRLPEGVTNPFDEPWGAAATNNTVEEVSDDFLDS